MFDVKVSDHAVVRYLERVRGVDIDRVRAEITAQAGGAAACGAKLTRKGGLTYVLERGTIVTVLPDDRQRAPRRGR